MTDPIAPPTDLDAEAAVVSAVALSPDHLAEVERIVTGLDFFSDANRYVYEAIVDLDRAGSSVDTTTIAAKLRDANRFETVGGAKYLSRLIDATPAVAHVEDHARIVAGKAAVRRMQAVCAVIRSEGYTEIEDVNAWLQTAYGRVYDEAENRRSVETLSTMHEMVEDEIDAMNARRTAGAKVPGLTTGLHDLDYFLAGLKRGLQYIVAGRPGHGKTALALTIALHVAAHGEGVVFVSGEMPREQLTQRALAQAAFVNLSDLISGKLSPKDLASVMAAGQTLARLPLVVDDKAAPTLMDVRNAVRRGQAKFAAREQPTRVGLVVVDYLQLMKGEIRRGDRRDNAISDLSKGLLEIAREFDCVTMPLSQLNRSIESRDDKTPRLSDLRESGSIEEDAFAVLFLYRADAYKLGDKDKDGTARVIIAKHRNGKTGSVDLAFKDTSTGFFNLTMEERDE